MGEREGKKIKREGNGRVQRGEGRGRREKEGGI